MLDLATIPQCPTTAQDGPGATTPPAEVISSTPADGTSPHSASRLAVALCGFRIVIEERPTLNGAPCDQSFIVRVPRAHRVVAMRLFAALPAFVAATGWEGE